jgi:hypothetical protein
MQLHFDSIADGRFVNTASACNNKYPPPNDGDDELFTVQWESGSDKAIAGGARIADSDITAPDSGNDGVGGVAGVDVVDKGGCFIFPVCTTLETAFFVATPLVTAAATAAKLSFFSKIWRALFGFIVVIVLFIVIVVRKFRVVFFSCNCFLHCIVCNRSFGAHVVARTHTRTYTRTRTYTLD